jgi:D-inositol-3-phosphate glycosyltransferase
MKPPVTILIVGQAAQKTGLARVTLALADHLAGDYDIHVLGIDCFDHHGSKTTARGWTLHGNPFSYDVFAELRLTELVDQIRPAIVVLYNDAWVIYRYFQRLERAAHKSATVGYCPVDGRILSPDLISSLMPLDALVVFTEFARAVVRECAEQERLAEQPLFRSVQIIPHGLDAKDFHPWPPDEHDRSRRRLAARQTLFPDQPELWEGFWVLNANRNQPRKCLDLTLDGFARFAADKPANVRLYLHTGLKEIGVDILKHARLSGITERLILTRSSDDHPELPTSKLNLIYNACDVGVNTSTGEGWGLVSCEHAATGAPQIVPRHSACEEIWNGAAELLTPVRTFSTGMLEGKMIAAEDLAESLERLYSDSSHYDHLSQAAYLRATDEAYRWDLIATRWLHLFEELPAKSCPHDEVEVYSIK